MRLPRLLLASSLALCLASPGAGAAPDDKKACLAAFESSQHRRKEGKLRETRGLLEVCARDVCPKVVHAPCKEWLAEVQAEIPSLTVAVTDQAGNALSGVRVTLDGSEAQANLEMPLDPGNYAVRADKAGYKAASQRVDLAKKEKGRKITLSLEADAAPAPGGAPAPGASAPARGASPLAYVLGGVGAVGVGVFAWQGLAGRSEEQSLKNSCAPRCSPEQIREVDRRYLIADISLGVGVLALGAAAWLALSAPSSPPTSARVGVGAGRQGAFLLVHKGF